MAASSSPGAVFILGLAIIVTCLINTSLVDAGWPPIEPVVGGLGNVYNKYKKGFAKFGEKVVDLAKDHLDRGPDVAGNKAVDAIANKNTPPPPPTIPRFVARRAGHKYKRIVPQP